MHSYQSQKWFGFTKAWVYYGYGASMYQQVSSTGAEYKHWNLRGDLVEASSFVQIVNLCTIYGGE
jgi:hypothetical protein